jgi:DNA-binding beta-propeller fold protein YncE
LGSNDTEDVAVNPNNGHVFIVNGGDFGTPKIIETDATGSQIFSVIDLTAAVQGQPVGSPEGVAYDPAHDVFFVAGNNFDIKVVNRSGAVLDDITLLSNYRNPTGNIGTEIQGLTLAPSSDPNDDPAKMNLYVADAGLLSGHNDGRLIEIDLHSGLLYA